MFKKYFLHQITFISASTSKKKVASKEGNHTTEIIERERKKEKKKGQRARFSFLSTSAENCVIPFPDDG